jgi:hypothetical protein
MMATAGDRYRLLRKIGNDMNTDGTQGAPLLVGMVGVVKHSAQELVVLDFSTDEEGGMLPATRSVSFPPEDLTDPDLFELVEEE